MLKVVPKYEGKSENPNCLGSYSCSYMEADKYNDNNRFYPRSLIVNKILTKKTQTQLKNKLLLGEIDHPAQRFNTDMERVCICTTNLYFDESTNQLMGTFDVLDTPCGRIVKTLLDYGSVIGISARAMGSGKKTKEGEIVEESNYFFKTFDMVVEPGFGTSTIDGAKQELKESLKMIVESLDDFERDDAQNVIDTILNGKEDLPLVEHRVDSNLNEDFSTIEFEKELYYAELEGLNEANEAYLEYLNTIEMPTKDDLIEKLKFRCESLSNELLEKAYTTVSYEKEYNDSLDYINKLEESILQLKQENANIKNNLESIKVAHQEEIKSLMESKDAKIALLNENYQEELTSIECENEVLKNLVVSLKNNLHEGQEKKTFDINSVVKVVSLNESKNNAPKNIDSFTDRLLKNK